MSREAFEAWAIAETYAVREGEKLMWNYPCGFMAEEAWQAAQADAYERALRAVQHWDADSPVINDIRALAKAAGK